ncbi:MAG TPA: multicopper oxidase domain-containing protein, partial [Acidimicrobiales bacterium]|nr:multicopper oxidase domain-containing protein [Acidimicrobiales bacterium]
YELALSSGHTLKQIASDGGLLPGVVPRNTVAIWPGERVEVVVDFSQVPLGSQVVLRNLLGSGRTADVMRFDVVRRETDSSRVPRRLRPLERLAEASAAITRDFSFDIIGMPLAWSINGRVFDENRVDADPALGSTEIWRLTTPTTMNHPVHLHLVMFQVLDRNGWPPDAAESGWKDTVIVNYGEVVRVIARFEDYTGRYVFHCHNLEHEDHMMMAQFEVRDPTSGSRADAVTGGVHVGGGHTGGGHSGGGHSGGGHSGH